jgi:hypothetical protein
MSDALYSLPCTTGSVRTLTGAAKTLRHVLPGSQAAVPAFVQYLFRVEPGPIGCTAA